MFILTAYLPIACGNAQTQLMVSMAVSPYAKESIASASTFIFGGSFNLHNPFGKQSGHIPHNFAHAPDTLIGYPGKKRKYGVSGIFRW